MNIDYFEEKSTTGTAACQMCSGLIEKGTPRVGYKYTRYRWDGRKWCHLACISLKDLEYVLSQKRIDLRVVELAIIVKKKQEKNVEISKS